MALPTLADLYGPNATLDQYNQQKQQYMSDNNSGGMDLFDSIFSGDTSSLQRSMSSEQDYMSALSPQARAQYQQLAQDDMNSGFRGKLSKAMDTLGPMIAMAPLAIGAGGALGGLFGGATEGAVGGAGGFVGEGAASGVGAWDGALAGLEANAPAFSGAGGMFNNAAFTSFPSAPEGMFAGTYNNPAFVSMPGIAGGGVPATAVNAASSGGVSEFFDRLMPKSTAQGFDMGRSIASGLGAINNFNSSQNLKGLTGSLASMYGPGSAYEEQLRKQLARRDAASGRRSQYGPREVELQAKLAELNSRNAGTLGQLYGQQSGAENNMFKSLLNLGKHSGLLDMFAPKP